MNCPQCGEVCSCHLESPPVAVPRWRPDAGTCSHPAPARLFGPETSVDARLIESKASSEAHPAREVAPCTIDAGELSSPVTAEAAPLESSHDKPGPSPGSRANPGAEATGDPAWRNELSARLKRYRARRKIRPPRYASLQLPFETVEFRATAKSQAVGFEQASNHALALDGTTATHIGQLEAPPPETKPEASPSLDIPATHAGAKIIEFPRFNFDQPSFEPPVPPPDQLAEPVSERPRILEVPEVSPPPPALGGITIEPPQLQEADKRLGLEVPLESASLARRILSGGIDGLIVAAASAAFGVIFWKITAIRPPLSQLLAMAGGVPCVLWAAYQYLLIVYAGRTPGSAGAKLELVRFDGTATTRSLRRWRVIASYLSAASLGLGYIWVFLDEDVLCWHDRITHTYLAPRKAAPAR